MEGWFRGDEREIVVMEQNEFENGGRHGWCRVRCCREKLKLQCQSLHSHVLSIHFKIHKSVPDFVTL